jgi:hypothetical protein
MFNLEKIKAEIENLDDDDMRALWNDYCDNNSYYDDWIEYNEPDDLFYGYSPSEILNKIDFGNYNQSDRYCVLDGYGQFISFDYIDDDDSPFDLDSLAQWIRDNEDALGYLDEYDITDHFDAYDFVDEYFNDDDVENFIADNDLDVDEDVDKYDAVKDYLESLDDDTEEIEAALSGLGWLCDIEERVLQYFN